MEEKECLGEYKNESNKCRSCKDKKSCKWKQFNLIQFTEKILGIKLLPLQKEFLKKPSIIHKVRKV